MLSGEGNENSEKTSIGLINKKATLHVQHTFFLYISLPLFFKTTTWDLKKLPSYTRFMEEIVHFFFTAAHFHLQSATKLLRHCIQIG